MSEIGGIQIRKPKAKKSEGLWLTSFSDLSLLLMCFFALMLSMSNMNNKKFEDVIEEMKVNKVVEKLNNLDQVEKNLTQEIERQNLKGVVSVKQDVEGVAVEFKDNVLFTPGAAKIGEEQAKMVASIMAEIAKTNPKYKITVEGHTDDTPLGSNAKYHSNWELSAARGISILNQLQAIGIPKERMRVVSYADTKPKDPIQGKTGQELSQARAANRRVVIRLD